MIGFVFISHYDGIIIFINNLNIVNYIFKAIYFLYNLYIFNFCK